MNSMERALEAALSAEMGEVKQKLKDEQQLTEGYWPSLEDINAQIHESLSSDHDRMAIALWYELSMSHFPARLMLAEVTEMNGNNMLKSKRLVCAMNGWVLDPHYDTAIKREELAEYEWLLVSGTAKDMPWVPFTDG